MAIGWIKSLQCKSNAAHDVVSSPKTPNLRTHSCRGLKDAAVVETATVNRSKTPQQKPSPAGGDSQFPSLGGLPSGHPSRNVVEIIFRTSWGEKDFPGRVEMVLKIRNSTRTVSRFEEYREMVKHRSGGGGEDHARRVADGNEVMRFYCLGEYEDGGGAWGLRDCRRAGVRTFSWGGVAHENGGGGRGRRAMMVCRVIAGRVFKRLKFGPVVEGETGYDSVGGGNGELIVFDARAVLPCFLIIYQL